MTSCSLCLQPGGEIIHTNDRLRIVLADEPEYPGTLRVVWRQHVKEMTDLSLPERRLVMDHVWACESALRAVTGADKVNLASLGNMTPHLHWHVIPRFTDDPTFPASIWSAKVRTQPHRLAGDLHAALTEAILVQLGNNSD